MLSLVGGELYQWDTGRVVKVVPDENVTVHEVHFSTKRMDYAYVLKTYVEDGVTYCAIPNLILQQSNRLLCYEVCQNSDGEETIADTYFDIIKRNRPEDYVYTEQEHFTIQNLSDRVDELEAWKNQNSSIVKYTDQSLTDEQKAQARENLDAASKKDIVQADWNESNPFSLNYIKNRPFYSEENAREVLGKDFEEWKACVLAHGGEISENDPAGWPITFSFDGVDYSVTGTFDEETSSVQYALSKFPAITQKGYYAIIVYAFGENPIVQIATSHGEGTNFYFDFVIPAKENIKYLSPKFIKDMYYSETNEVEVGSGFAGFAASNQMQDGPIQKVEFQGTIYENIPVDHTSNANIYYIIGDYTVCFDRRYADVSFDPTGPNESDLTFYKTETTYHKIAPEYISDEIARTSQVMKCEDPVGSGSFSMNRAENTTIGSYSHAEGYMTTASREASHAEGYMTTASGNASHAEGRGTTASKSQSHAEGNSTTASGFASHAEGDYTKASGANAHSEGSYAIASGDASHAEGYKTTASGGCAHAEGGETTASLSWSHAEGRLTKANSACSHAEGFETTANGSSSHAEGDGTIASAIASHAQGKYNIEDTEGKLAHIVGNGSSSTKRSNAHTLDWDGNAWFSGNVYVGSTSGTNKDNDSKKLATESFVTEQLKTIPASTSDILEVHFTVTTSGLNTTWTADKTYAEIKDALEANKTVIGSNGSIQFGTVYSDSVAIYFTRVDSHGETFTVQISESNSISRFTRNIKSLYIKNASVGQIAKIKTVDDNGAPTSWESVNLPTKTSQLTNDSGYISSISVDGTTIKLNDQGQLTLALTNANGVSF